MFYLPYSRQLRLILLFFILLPCVAAPSTFLLGIDVFIEGYIHLVKDHRLGLITNQTGKDSNGEATVDLLHRHPQVNLVALFAPEHGIRGTLKAGENVPGSTDSKTGLPIFSLYGGNDHRPPRVALDMVDTVIYDIQDVGSRAYTYIWSMAEAMAAAGETRKNFIVLDRPNPLSCSQFDGPITEKQWLSFIGLYPIPRVYGMTVGELARYLNREHQLNCRLTVIPMAAYTRTTTWHNINLNWIPPSPNIPSVESAMCFAATGTIGVLGNVHIGIGTEQPFQIFGAPWLDNAHAVEYLNTRKLRGVKFTPFQFHSTSGLFMGENVNAVKINVRDVSRFLPATTELTILDYLHRFYPNDFRWAHDKLKAFDKAMGTSRIRNGITTGRKVEELKAIWKGDLTSFRIKRQPYLIYQ